MSTVSAGTVIEVKNREQLEKLIFGNITTIDNDKFEYFARKSFLDFVEEQIRQGGTLMKL
jgi:hypothetical protein